MVGKVQSIFTITEFIHIQYYKSSFSLEVTLRCHHRRFWEGFEWGRLRAGLHIAISLWQVASARQVPKVALAQNSHDTRGNMSNAVPPLSDLPPSAPSNLQCSSSALTSPTDILFRSISPTSFSHPRSERRRGAMKASRQR